MNPESDESLRRLLSSPGPEIPDDGFALRVVAALPRRPRESAIAIRRRTWIVGGAAAAGFILALSLAGPGSIAGLGGVLLVAVRRVTAPESLPLLLGAALACSALATAWVLARER